MTNDDTRAARLVIRTGSSARHSSFEFASRFGRFLDAGRPARRVSHPHAIYTPPTTIKPTQNDTPRAAGFGRASMKYADRVIMNSGVMGMPFAIRPPAPATVRDEPARVNVVAAPFHLGCRNVVTRDQRRVPYEANGVSAAKTTVFRRRRGGRAG
jgi:hypothetical protein